MAYDTYLICDGCGKRDSFRRVAHGNCHYTEEEICDGYGEIQEYENADYYNHDIGDYEDYVCLNTIYCAYKTKVQEFDEQTDLIKYIEKHTDKKGKWHKKQLPKNKRSDKIAMMFVAKEE